MLRRSTKGQTTLDLTKKHLAQQEAELRATQEKLEKMIAEAPRMAEEEARRQREDLRLRAGAEQTRLDVSLSANPWIDRIDVPRRGELRRKRREGRIIFLLLILTLAAAVIWLIAHFRGL
jgi:septal ring factor EnvC (AmiA/AmiB activator)